MRSLVSLSLLLAACGGSDAVAPDAPDAPDAASPHPDAKNCPQTVLYLAHSGGMYTGGMDDSRTNTSSILHAPATIAARGDDGWDVVKSCVTAGLVGFPVTVTDVDPGTAPHFEIVFTTSIPGLPAQNPGVTSFSCGVRANDIAWVSKPASGAPAVECGVALGLFGAMHGLEYTTNRNDFMSFTPCATGCSFKAIDEACGGDQPTACQCGGTTENPAAKLGAALCP